MAYYSMKKILQQLIDLYSEGTIYIKHTKINMELTIMDLMYLINSNNTIDLRVDDNIILSIEISTMPNCCGVIVFGNAGLNKKYYKKGTFTILLKLLSKVNKRYGMALATTKVSNTSFNRILEKSNWNEVKRFINPNSGNELILWKDK